MGATLRDVAKAAGVSLATASYALSGKGSLSTETRASVQRTARELGYRRRHHLQRRIALLHAEPDPVRSDLFTRFMSALRQEDFELIPICWPAAEHREAGLPAELRTQRFDGVIVFGGLIDPHFAERLAAALPAVFLGGTYLDLNVDSVWADATQGIYKAVAHLVDLGHRRIGLIPGPTATFTTAEKLAGYQQALATRGIPYRPEWVRTTHDFGTQAGTAAARALLRQTPRPTAIIAGQPSLATGCLLAARALNLAVPGDLSLFCFEDRTSLADTMPAISAIDIAVRDIVAAAHATLLERIRDPERAARRIRTATSLRVRQSVGPCAASA